MWGEGESSGIFQISDQLLKQGHLKSVQRIDGCIFSEKSLPQCIKRCNTLNTDRQILIHCHDGWYSAALENTYIENGW